MHRYKEGSFLQQGFAQERAGNIVHINTVELLAVLRAVQIILLETKSTSTSRPFRLIIMCDNKGVCDVVSSMKSDDLVLNLLLRDLQDELVKGVDLPVQTSTQLII
jgi:hypothetical protein